MSAAEERRWGRMAWTMEQFHMSFRYTFDELYNTADRKRLGSSLTAFLREGYNFIHHLEVHHTIEERHIFPVLQKKMPDFAKNAKHRNSHKAIHEGLERFETLLKSYGEDLSSYNPVEFRACLDSFKEVLFRHLDEEVEDLGAENLKKYYTLAEVDRLPM